MREPLLLAASLFWQARVQVRLPDCGEGCYCQCQSSGEGGEARQDLGVSYGWRTKVPICATSSCVFAALSSHVGCYNPYCCLPSWCMARLSGFKDHPLKTVKNSPKTVTNIICLGQPSCKYRQNWRVRKKKLRGGDPSQILFLMDISDGGRQQNILASGFINFFLDGSPVRKYWQENKLCRLTRHNYDIFWQPVVDKEITKPSEKMLSDVAITDSKINTSEKWNFTTIDSTRNDK